MVPADTPETNVVALRSPAVDSAEVRALSALRDLVAEIDDALHAVDDGDVDSVFRLHRLAGRAVTLVMANGLATPASWDWRPGA